MFTHFWNLSVDSSLKNHVFTKHELNLNYVKDNFSLIMRFPNSIVFVVILFLACAEHLNHLKKLLWNGKFKEANKEPLFLIKWFFYCNTAKLYF